MLPGTPSRPSFTVTVDLGGSAAGAGAGGVVVAAAGVAAGAGGGGAGGGGGGELVPPSCAWASHPRIAGAPNAKRAVNIKGATFVRAIFVLLVVSCGFGRQRSRGSAEERVTAAFAVEPPLGRISRAGSSIMVKRCETKESHVEPRSRRSARSRRDSTRSCGMSRAGW